MSIAIGSRDLTQVYEGNIFEIVIEGFTSMICRTPAHCDLIQLVRLAYRGCLKQDEMPAVSDESNAPWILVSIEKVDGRSSDTITFRLVETAAA